MSDSDVSVPIAPRGLLSTVPVTYADGCARCALVRNFYQDLPREIQGPPQHGVSVVPAASVLYQRMQDGHFEEADSEGCPWDPPTVCSHCVSAFASPHQAYPCARTMCVEVLMAYRDQHDEAIIERELVESGAESWLAFHSSAIVSTLDEVVPSELATCAAAGALRKICAEGSFPLHLQGCAVQLQLGSHESMETREKCKFSHEEGRFWCLAPECTKGCNHRGLFACWEKPMAVRVSHIHVSMLSGPVFAHLVGDGEFPILDRETATVADVFTVLLQLGTLPDVDNVVAASGMMAVLPRTCQLRMLCDYFGVVVLQVSVSDGDDPIPQHTVPVEFTFQAMDDKIQDHEDNARHIPHRFLVCAGHSVTIGFLDRNRYSESWKNRHVTAFDLETSARVDFPMAGVGFDWSWVTMADRAKKRGFSTLSSLDTSGPFVHVVGSRLFLSSDNDNRTVVVLNLADPTDEPVMRRLPFRFPYLHGAQTQCGTWIVIVPFAYAASESDEDGGCESVSSVETDPSLNGRIRLILVDTLSLTPVFLYLEYADVEGYCEHSTVACSLSGELVIGSTNGILRGKLIDGTQLRIVDLPHIGAGDVRMCGRSHYAAIVSRTEGDVGVLAVLSFNDDIVVASSLQYPASIRMHGFLMAFDPDLSDVVGVAVAPFNGTVNAARTVVRYGARTWASGVVDLTTNVVTEGVCVRDDGSVAVGVFDRDTGDLLSGRIQNGEDGEVLHVTSLFNTNASLPEYWSRADHADIGFEAESDGYDSLGSSEGGLFQYDSDDSSLSDSTNF